MRHEMIERWRLVKPAVINEIERLCRIAERAAGDIERDCGQVVTDTTRPIPLDLDPEPPQCECCRFHLRLIRGKDGFAADAGSLSGLAYGWVRDEIQAGRLMSWYGPVARWERILERLRGTDATAVESAVLRMLG
jgi:hypothetical protein